MKKRLFSLIILTFPMCMIASCDDGSIKAATFHIYNNSRFQVTKIIVPMVSIEKSVKDSLESGESCTLIGEWVESKSIYATIDFYMNGEKYRTAEKGEAMRNPRQFKPCKRINNGDTITVNIYDDHWEW